MGQAPAVLNRRDLSGSPSADVSRLRSKRTGGRRCAFSLPGVRARACGAKA